MVCVGDYQATSVSFDFGISTIEGGFAANEAENASELARCWRSYAMIYQQGMGALASMLGRGVQWAQLRVQGKRWCIPVGVGATPERKDAPGALAEKCGVNHGAEFASLQFQEFAMEAECMNNFPGVVHIIGDSGMELW